MYYALVTVTYEEMWQISYLYYLKAILLRNGITLQHIDLNIKRYIECGRGERRIQSSLTLNQERDINCTSVILGFHENIRHWWHKTIVPESTKKTIYDHRTNCLKTQKVYLPIDKKKYDDFVPVVYGTGTLGCSKPRSSMAPILISTAGQRQKGW